MFNSKTFEGLAGRKNLAAVRLIEPTLNTGRDPCFFQLVFERCDRLFKGRDARFEFSSSHYGSSVDSHRQGL